VIDALEQHARPAAHLIGIAGAGMQSLAAVLLARGWRVRGSDRNPRAAAKLRALGAEVLTGHDAAYVSRDAQLVIYSDAVPPENVERRRAAELSIETSNYPEALGRLSRGGLIRLPMGDAAAPGATGSASAIVAGSTHASHWQSQWHRTSIKGQTEKPSSPSPAPMANRQ
jgi:UDP-N-acetylmuramate--alanine ligase